MRHLRKEPKKPLPIIIASLVLIMAVAAAVLFIPQLTNEKGEIKKDGINNESVVNSSSSAPEKDTSENKDNAYLTESTLPKTENMKSEKPVIRDYSTVELVNGTIATPYGTIIYPESLTDNLVVINTGEKPYVLEFYALLENRKEVRLFDLSFGEGSGGNMGEIIIAEGTVPLNANIYRIPENIAWTDSELTTLYAMQDAINDILENLDMANKEENKAEISVEDQPEDNGTINNIKIETPVTDIYYPSEFRDTVKYTCDDKEKGIYKVHFFAELENESDVALFSIYFGGDEGEQLGIVEDSSGNIIPVYLIIKELETENLTDKETELLYTMQEASNSLIERLPLIEA